MRSCQVGWLIMAHFMSNVWSSQDSEKFVCPDGSQALSVRTPTAVTRLSLSARSQELIVTTEPILAGIKEKKASLNPERGRCLNLVTRLGMVTES